MTRKGQSVLKRDLLRGGALAFEGLDQQTLLTEANALGLSFAFADCDRARSRSAVLRAIAKAVEYPEYFGSNLDSLYDCLCDTLMDQKEGTVLWLHRLHSGDPVLEEDALQIAAICANAADFAKENGRVFAFAIDHAGKHPDPEPGVAATPYGASVE